MSNENPKNLCSSRLHIMNGNRRSATSQRRVVIRDRDSSTLREGQTPKKCRLLCNCSSVKDACPLVALTAPQQNNVSHSLCSVFLSPCILHVCPRKCLHYKCDMLAYNDAQRSIWSACSLNSAAAFNTDLRLQSRRLCSWLVVSDELGEPQRLDFLSAQVI